MLKSGFLLVSFGFLLLSNVVRAGSDMWDISGNTAVVTGGTKGIGRAIVEELAAKNARVLTCARRKGDVEKCVEEWKSMGYDVTGVVADVASPEGRDGLMADIKNWLGEDGKLDILVNNVGTNYRVPSIEYTQEDIQKMLDTNFISMFMLTTACHPLLKRNPGERFSSVVNIASVAGVSCMKSGSPYAGTKAAMCQVTGNWACEWGRDGIRVNCVAPWYFRTDLVADLFADKKFLTQVLERTPMARCGEPPEIGGLVTYLCLPIAQYINGQVLSVDGGFTRQGFYDPFYP